MNPKPVAGQGCGGGHRALFVAMCLPNSPRRRRGTATLPASDGMVTGGVVVSDKKPVYFMEAILLHPDGSVHEWGGSDFWQVLHRHVANLPLNERRYSFRGIRYGGSARTEKSPAVDYLYVGKRRWRSDFSGPRSLRH